MLFGKYINKYYKKYFLLFLVGVIALVAVDYFQLEIPNITGKIIDGIRDGSLFGENSKMLHYMLYLALIAFIMFVGRFAWRYAVFGAAVRIEADIRDDMFNHSLKLSNQFYKEHKIGQLMALFTNDLQAIRQTFGGGTVMLIDSLFLGGIALFKMIRLNWLLAVFSVIPMSLIVVVSLIVGKFMERRFKARQEAYDALSDFSQENFSGISVIKAFVKEIFEIKHFEKLNENNYEKNISYLKLGVLLDVLLTGVLSTIIAILFGGGAYFVINERVFFGETFTAGKLFEFIGYFSAVIWPFMAISMLIQMRAQGKASYKRVEEFLDSKVDIYDTDIIDTPSIRGEIEFKHLDFMYPDGSENALSDISFRIDEGMMVGIVGKTGCGKTTIVDLLLRTYNVKEGSLFIDGVDIMHLPFKKVRDSIGYVPQDNFLFSDTIANNIGFFAENPVSEEKIEAAARLAVVDENIKDFDNQYMTVLGERGVTLSGGQKQRVSIARALIKDPAILIFDDSVSAVDTDTESKILTNLRNVRKGKTTIMIAHRISTVETLDMIVLMDEGKVVDVGTHNELLRRNELYKQMVHLQELEKEVGGEANE